jgi:hypothetical protein
MNDNRAYSKALFRALSAANVKFVRYHIVDILNNPRCKVVPLDYLRKKDENALDEHCVEIATVCCAGLPSFADSIIPGTGLTAVGSLVVCIVFECENMLQATAIYWYSSRWPLYQ